VGAADGRVRDAAGWEGHQAKALDLAAALATEKPDDRGRRQKLAQAHEWLADVRLRTGRPAEAAKGYAAAAAVYRELAAADPTNPDALRDLGRVTYSQGLAALRAGDRAAAGKFFAESLAPRRNRPGLAADLTAQRDLMMSLARTGGHGEAVEMAEAVRAKLPKDPGALVDIACCYAVSSAAVPAGADRDRYAAKALEALGQAIDAGYGDKVNLETEPDLDGVRVRPEFKALVDRVPEP
ncbi:MAG: hypothetical protein K2X82_24905, partial [Gemmataceae bacterium]|nr:hypothetical protein [Gemmataceae bacterium]